MAEMKPIQIDAAYGDKVEFSALQADTSPLTHLTVDESTRLTVTAVLGAEDVVKLRDWLNERVRELIFFGHLDSHLGD